MDIERSNAEPLDRTPRHFKLSSAAACRTVFRGRKKTFTQSFAAGKDVLGFAAEKRHLLKVLQP
jgi:hypothetical protein